jgi:2-keto-4-pentenoate hydratase/2-oxohepta-3-ene-1,7-dioic acid hydratase in catechol pathway
MKLANVNGRAALVFDDAIADVEKASSGRFGPDPMNVFENWGAFVVFARGVTAGDAPFVEAQLRCPVPNPRQVFAIGINYGSHAEESGMAVPEVPATFTKFPASLAGPFDDIEIVATPSTGKSNWSRSSAPAPTASPKLMRGSTSRV